MSTRRTREFALTDSEILEYLVADNSDDEDGLFLDEEDQQFLAQDIDEGLSNVEIEPSIPPSVSENIHNEEESQSQQEIPQTSSEAVPSFKWRKNSYIPHQFRDQEGYKYGEVNILDSLTSSDFSPINIFNAVTNFDQLIDDIIVPESERYALQNGRSFTLSSAEAKAYLGMNYVMGYHILPSFRSYWSTEPDMGVPYIANIMPLNRFEEIRRNLHFSDNTKEPSRNQTSYDRAYKIRPVLDHFNRSFQNAMTNTKTQAIDEHMIKFKGHNIMRQYVKNKPVKWGFKMWCRADSTTGYLFQFDLYTGRKQGGAETGLGESVVLQLSKGLQGLGCEVYFDNFFNSPILQHKLAHMNIRACGTVRSNRKNIPKNVPADKTMQRGEIFATSSQGISFIKWMDNKPVFLLTNFLSPIPTTTVKRRVQGSGEKINVTCPEVVVKYNKNMGGVDLMDQRKVCYEVDRKAKIKFYLRLFFDLQDIAMNNAYIVYSKLHGEKKIEGTLLSCLEFRQAVSRSLIADFSTRQRSFPSSVATTKRISHAQKRETPSHIMVKANIRKRCVQCAKSHVENRTNNTCSTCNVHLCFTSERNCFAEYH